MVDVLIPAEHDSKRQLLGCLDGVKGHADSAQTGVLAKWDLTVEQQTACIYLQTVVADIIGSTDRLYISEESVIAFNGYNQRIGRGILSLLEMGNGY